MEDKYRPNMEKTMEDKYRLKMVCLLNKVLKDEISASIFYSKASKNLIGPAVAETAEELMTHSKEEMVHFNKLLDFASSHGVIGDIKIELDEGVVDFPEITEIKEVMRKVQELELQAIDDYKMAAMCARKNNDIESNRFFVSLMQDEIKHFDELAYVNGDTRPLVGLSSIGILISN